MSRYREVTPVGDGSYAVQLWPGAELDDGSDHLELARSEAFVRLGIEIDHIRYEINQVNNTTGGTESILSWHLHGISQLELLVLGDTKEPAVADSVNVLLIPARENAVNLTAPISGFGIRSAMLRLFIAKQHLEVLKERIEQGLCERLEAILRFELPHHVGEGIYLVQDGGEYEGTLESIQLDVAPGRRGAGKLPEDRPGSPVVAGEPAPEPGAGSGEWAAGPASGNADSGASDRLDDALGSIRLHLKLTIGAVCLLAVALLLAR